MSRKFWNLLNLGGFDEGWNFASAMEYWNTDIKEINPLYFFISK